MKGHSILAKNNAESKHYGKVMYLKLIDTDISIKIYDRDTNYL